MSDLPSRRVAFVTGAGRGIGFGIAKALADAGYAVALADVDGDSARAASSRLNAEGHETLGLTLDVTDAISWDTAIHDMVYHWGGLDVLVNNAGISPRGTAESTDEPLWERTLAVNLKGPWLGIKTALPWLKQRRGTIVNIGSTRATRPRLGMAAYCSSKAGLWGLTQQVAIDYLEDGVTCNMVAPGWVDTEGERVIQANHGRPDFPAGTRNLITPAEIGAAVVYLASAPGRRVNGQTLYVDAGLHVADNAEMIYLKSEDERGYT